MKKNTLYTVNPWNKHIFANGGDTWDVSKYGDPNSKGGLLNLSKQDNPFSKGNINTTVNGIASAVSPMLTNFISNGYESTAGNLTSTIGNAASEFLPEHMKWAGKLGSAVIGAGLNRLVGMKVDQKALSNANQSIAANNNFVSNASSFDDDILTKGLTGVANVGSVYKGGLFRKGDARNKNAQLQNDLANAVLYAQNSIDNNIENLQSNQFNGLLANVSALGGPLQPFTQQTGALGIMQQDKYINAINNRTNAIAKNTQAPYSFSATGNRFDAGGDIDAAFFDAFTSGKDPLGAVTAYNQAKENLANQEAARRDAEAQQAALQDTMGRLQASEIQNQGLLSLLNAQGQSIDVLRDQLAGLQEAGNAAADTQATAPQTEAQGAPGGSLREFIKSHEGWLGNAYWLDGESAPTIGYGFHMVYPGTNKRVKMGDRITREEGDRYLDVAINNLSDILSKKVPNWGNLSSNQKDALIDLAYATGPYGKHFQKNSKLFQALAAGDMETAAKHLYASSASKKEYNKYLKKVGEARRDMFTNGNYKMKAFGGELGTNGTDFTSGLLEVNTGDSHEENPYGGIQLGVDQEGVPNLVEEGETVFNDYVFSNRLKVPSFMRKQLGLGGNLKKDITFADASKKIVKDSKERPNNPMDQEYMEGALGKLAMVQETERSRMKAEQENQMLEAAMFGFGGKKRTEAMPQSTKSGNKFDGTTTPTQKMNRRWNTGNFDWLKGDFKPSNGAGFIPYSRAMKPEDITAAENSSNFKAWSDYVLNNWDTPDVQSYLKALDAAAGGNHLFDAKGNPVKGAQDYYRRERGLGDKGNHKWGYYHLTPTELPTTPIELPDYQYGQYGYDSMKFPWTLTPEEAAAPAPENLSPMEQIARDKGVTVTDNGTNFTPPAVTGSEIETIEGEGEGKPVKSTANQPDPYPTWMRYAPVFGAGIMTLADALGLTNKPDYTFADKIEAAARAAGNNPYITAAYIGDYMRYHPLDRLFYANQLQANARATDRNLMNTSGGNSGTARAAMIANGYNSNNVIGNMLRQEAESNRAQYERTKEFNRKTNMVNAEMDMRAREANARYRHMANSAWLQGLGQAAALRDSIDQRVGAARSLNIKNLLESLGNIGRENFALNQIRADRAYNYAPTSTGWSDWKGRTQAFGGEVERYHKNKKQGRRSK